ncbi:hypothetical protein ACHQM5_014153 [Ranunculus cassubicifolius]
MAPGLVVTPTLRLLVDKLSSLTSREFRLLHGFNKDLEKFSQDMYSMQTTAEEFEKSLKKRIPIGPEKLTIIGFNDAAYDVEDILEEIELEALTWESQIEFGDMTCTNQVSHSLAFQFKRLKIRKQIKQLIKRFTIIKDYGFNYGFLAAPRDKETNEIPVIYGRERETENIIQVLLNNNNNTYHRLSICPIVGIAGLGKTTLAQLVYGDERIVNHFDARIWVFVVEDFGIQKITQVMINKLSGGICDIGQLDLMQNNLKLLLNGKRFLVVLDDVWNDDTEKWNELTQLFACGSKGSSVIVTTRLQTVVDNISGLSTLCVINPTCDLQPLHDDDALSLFKHYAVRDENEVNEDMIEIGKEIVAKCKGAPLPIKEIGEALHHTQGTIWSYYYRNSAFWVREHLEESKVRSSLKSRYYALPPIYRQCFAYCFIFPKGYEIEVEELIRLWIANGLVQTDETMELEDVANEIFKELVLKLFFQKAEKNWLGIKTFKLQDVMYDLAWLVARTECVALEDGDQLAEIPNDVRHLLVIEAAHSSGMVDTISKSFPHLRTCLFPPMYNPPLPIIFENLTSLRALHLRGSNIPNLPRSIENLKHLRYLNLSSSVELRFLPESICSLVYLQTLELSQCWKLQKLPKSISKLINLIYLYLSDCRSLFQLPDGIGDLINLRHLDLSECDSLIRIPDAIGQLRNLRHLDLHDCKIFSHLPDVIGQLTNLIYLDLSRCLNLYGLPDGIGKLVSLRRLNLSKLLELTHLPVLELILGSESGLSIKILHGLNNLEGELQIRGLGHVKDGAEAKVANLVAKENLSSLSLVWEDSQVDDKNNCEEVIKCMRPPRNLNKLVIEAYRGSVFPSWVKLLVNMVEIQLSGCSECEDLPPLGHLPLLRKLCIFRMHSLKRINKEFYGIACSGSEVEGTSQGEGFFPSLEELEIRELRNWEEWQVIDDKNMFLRLKRLRLDKCPNLASLPLPIQRSVQMFEITGCEKLMVISPPI